jgi:carbamate kinase
MRLVVVALGGNALLRRGEPADAAVQHAHVREAAGAVAELAERHALVVTHGNGPQIGLLALQGDAYPAVRPYPLDLLGAETEGMIGYLLEQELNNALPHLGAATLLTQVVVDPDDPAFSNPTKPIGPVYRAAEAERLAAERGWVVKPDGQWFRRVVPSPEPRGIVELRALQALLHAGLLVICAGGGGIPVVVERGRLRGVEAVVDKDLTAALVAEQLGADDLLLLTDVSAVHLGWGTPEARPLRRARPAELRALDLPAGSMGPKVEAACRFVDATGGRAGIGSLDQAGAILRGLAGTIITP